MFHDFGSILEQATPADDAGYRYFDLVMKKGDTAYAPGTTKKVLRANADGATVRYVIHATGTNGYADDNVSLSYL